MPVWRSLWGVQWVQFLLEHYQGGGIGAELTGGNFWQGVVIGGIVAGLNHVAHMENHVVNDQEDPRLSSKIQVKPINDGPVIMMGGSFDVFGVFEGAGMYMESWFTDKGLPNVGKLLSVVVSRKPNRAFGKNFSTENVINSAGKLTKLKNGVRQGFINQNGQELFNNMAKQYNAKIHFDSKKGHQYFSSGSLRVDFTSSSRNIPTLRINDGGKLYKIRTQ